MAASKPRFAASSTTCSTATTSIRLTPTRMTQPSARSPVFQEHHAAASLRRAFNGDAVDLNGGTAQLEGVVICVHSALVRLRIADAQAPVPQEICPCLFAGLTWLLPGCSSSSPPPCSPKSPSSTLSTMPTLLLAPLR